MWFQRQIQTLCLALLLGLNLPVHGSPQEKVGCNEMLEIHLAVPPGWSHPFDSQDIRVDASIIGPEGKTWTVPCYYHAEQDWRLRFSTPLVGEYT